MSCLGVLLLLATGCGTHVSVPAWQKTIDRYIDEQANGDPTALRDLHAAGDIPGVSLISKNYTYDSDDARGVLLGHRMIDGSPWFIFIVGMVDHGHVDDIRIAARTIHDGKPRWATSPRSREAFHTYRSWNLSEGRKRFPGRKTLPPEYRGFPRESDYFVLEVSDSGVVRVSHEESGARWTLDLTR
jgi:hypothetical protein